MLGVYTVYAFALLTLPSWFVTVIDNVPGLIMSLDRKYIATCVTLLKIVSRGTPFTLMTEVGEKFVPLT